MVDDKRAFFKMDVGYLSNPKVVGVLIKSPTAVLLHLASIAYGAQHLTDGFVPRSLIEQLTIGATADDGDMLVAAGLWVDVGDGTIYVHDFDKHQRSAAEAKAAETAGRRAALARWHADRIADGNADRIADRNAEGNAEGNAEPNAEPNAQREREKRDKEPPVAPLDDEPPAEDSKPRARKRARQLPEDWKPNDEHLNLARQMRVDPSIELANFRDHAQATGRTLKDWDAGFRTWLRKARPNNLRALPVDTGIAKPKQRTIDPDAPFQPPPRRFGEENRIR